MPFAVPETRYARSGDVNIAYQVVGEGPFDLVYVPGWISNIELMWEEPNHARHRPLRPRAARPVAHAGAADGRPARRNGGRRVRARGDLRLVRGRPAERALRRHVSRANESAR